MEHHINTGFGLDIDDLTVGIQLNIVSCPEFVLGINTMTGYKVYILLCNVCGQAFCGRGIIAYPAFCGLLGPIGGVAVTAQNNALMFGKGTANELLQCSVKVISLFQFICKFTELLSHNGVQGNVGTCDGLRRTQHTELKFVTCKGQGRGAVAVGGVLGD